MKKIDQLIHDASTCSPKLTDEKSFRQVWFTRGEMINLVNLVIAEGVKESIEITNFYGAGIKQTNDFSEKNYFAAICEGAKKVEHKLKSLQA